MLAMNKFPLNGFFAIDKEKGWTSFDVVAKVRSVLGNIRTGHAGTLDPNASGLLLLGVNKFTKILSFISQEEKEYEGEIFLGATSDTDDVEGNIKENKSYTTPTEQDIKNLIQERFIGEILQEPPQFSAKKISGTKAYELARAGKRAKLPSSKVYIYEIKVLDFKFPILKIYVKCSAGFYVRSLARDLGRELQCGAYLQDLKRTSIGKVRLDKAIKVSDLSLKNAEKHLLNLDEISTMEVRKLEDKKRFLVEQKIDVTKLGFDLKKEEEKFFLVSGNRLAVVEKINEVFRVTKTV